MCAKCLAGDSQVKRTVLGRLARTNDASLQFDPASFDSAGHALQTRWTIQSGVFGRHIFQLALVLVFDPGIEIELLQETMPKVIDRMEARFAHD